MPVYSACAYRATSSGRAARLPPIHVFRHERLSMSKNLGRACEGETHNLGRVCGDDAWRAVQGGATRRLVDRRVLVRDAPVRRARATRREERAVVGGRAASPRQIELVELVPVGEVEESGEGEASEGEACGVEAPVAIGSGHRMAKRRHRHAPFVE